METWPQTRFLTFALRQHSFPSHPTSARQNNCDLSIENQLLFATQLRHNGKWLIHRTHNPINRNARFSQMYALVDQTRNPQTRHQESWPYKPPYALITPRRPLSPVPLGRPALRSRTRCAAHGPSCCCPSSTSSPGSRRPRSPLIFDSESNASMFNVCKSF